MGFQVSNIGKRNRHMDNKESIKLKIRALLAKTTDNGATEQEMILAMEKASELMEKYYIDSNDLNDPFLGEKCVFVKTPLHNSRYDSKLFLPYLAKMFDCEYYFNRYDKELTFFGFENDAELCVYFYKTVIKTMLKELSVFQSSRDFRYQQRYSPTKTINNSFIKGFVFRVSEKLDDIYRARQVERTKERGLVLREKSQKVKDAFADENIKVTLAKTPKLKVEMEAFEMGQRAGDSFSITQGIKSGQNASVKQLN